MRIGTIYAGCARALYITFSTYKRSPIYEISQLSSSAQSHMRTTHKCKNKQQHTIKQEQVISTSPTTPHKHIFSGYIYLQRSKEARGSARDLFLIHTKHFTSNNDYTQLLNRFYNKVLHHNIMPEWLSKIMGNSISLEEELINLRLTSKQMQRASKKCDKNEKEAVKKLKKVSLDSIIWMCRY